MKDEKIIMNSLLEEREALEQILFDCRDASCRIISTTQLEEDIIDWANNLLLLASENEPGQVNLVPKKAPRVIETPHQHLGAGEDCIEPLSSNNH